MISKKPFMAIIILFLFIISGCSDPVSIVKKGKLPINNFVTIGDVFKNYKFFKTTEWILHDNNIKQAPIVEFRGNFNPKFFIGLEDSDGNELTSDLINYFLSRHTLDDTYSFTYIAYFRVDPDKKNIEFQRNKIKFNGKDELYSEDICEEKNLLQNIYDNQPFFQPILSYFTAYKIKTEEIEQTLKKEAKLKAEKEAERQKKEAELKIIEAKERDENNKREAMKYYNNKAYFISQSFVKERLKSPSSADFPSAFNTQAFSVTAILPNKYMVSSYVDAQNSFGAKIRSRYSCTLKHENNNWSLESLNIY